MTDLITRIEDGVPLREIVNFCALADNVERAFALFEDEERKKLAGEPHDCRGAQEHIDRAVEAYSEAVAPKTLLMLAVEVLARRNEELAATLRAHAALKAKETSDAE